MGQSMWGISTLCRKYPIQNKKCSKIIWPGYVQILPQPNVKMSLVFYNGNYCITQSNTDPRLFLTWFPVYLWIDIIPYGDELEKISIKYVWKLSNPNNYIVIHNFVRQKNHKTIIGSIGIGKCIMEPSFFLKRISYKYTENW